MQSGKRIPNTAFFCTVALLVCGTATAGAEAATTTYPAMAPLAQYRLPSASAEIELSRSAAPASISSAASVLTLGSHGYETAVTGTNGFVCLVERSWAAGFDDAEFWNPKLRAPICFNAAAARTVLPTYLKRTEWVIAGASKSDIVNRSKATRAVTLESGAMSFMMSKQAYLGDAAGHWHPHLMFFLAQASGADWGADLHGSPVFAAHPAEDPFTTFFVPVPAWSDGTPAVMEVH